MWRNFPPHEPEYVKGDAKNMPFHENFFDIVISHGAPPTLPVTGEEELITVVSEIQRILKPDGEAYIFPGYFDLFVGDISSENLSSEEKQKEYSHATIKTKEFLARNFSELRAKFITLPQQEGTRPQQYMVFKKYVS